MKNKKILTTLTALATILAASAGAEVVLNQEDIKISPRVDFVGSFTLSATDINFGVVANPEVDQKITVDGGGLVTGAGTTANVMFPSLVKAGSITVEGDVATLHENSAVDKVYINMPSSITLSATGVPTCAIVEFPNDIEITDEGVFPYGGILTLKTSEIGKHCTGTGEITLIADVFEYEAPTTPEPEPEEPEPEYVFNSTTGFYELTDPETGEVSYYWYDKIDDTYVPVEEYRYKDQYLEDGFWEGIEDSVFQTMDNYIQPYREYYTEPSDLHVGNKDYEEDITISLVDPDSEFYEYTMNERDFLDRTDNASLSLYAMLHSDSGDYQDDGLLLKYDDIDTNGYIRIPVFGDRGDTVSGEVGPSLLDKNSAQHITESQDYVLEIPFAENIYLTQYGIQWVGPDISGSTLQDGNSVLRLYSGSIEDGKLLLEAEGTYSYLYGLFH